MRSIGASTVSRQDQWPDYGWISGGASSEHPLIGQLARLEAPLGGRVKAMDRVVTRVQRGQDRVSALSDPLVPMEVM